MYTKNLEQLLRLLQSSKQSGLLIVEKTEQEGAFWQGYFRLVDGNVVGCRVYRKIDRQILLQNDEAIRWLIGQGKLEWRLEEGDRLSAASQQLLPEPHTSGPEERGPGNETRKQLPPPPSMAPQAAWTPRRTRKGSMTPAKALGSLEHLQVFTLVNGQNSVEGIARLLRKPPQYIATLLNQMRMAGLIE